MKVCVRLIPMLVCMGIIFFFSHQPGDSLALPLFPGADKVAHALAYGVLSWTVIFSFSPALRRRRPGLALALAILVPVVFGISDEYHQSFIAGRNPEFLDLAADAAGALAVSLFWFFKTSQNQNDK